jgi:hypothetical protein
VGFKAFCLRGFDVMAYLDTQLSKQGMRIVADNIPVETEPPASVAAAVAESGNNQMGRLLNDEKIKLINAICQFPATALWLLNAHGPSALAAGHDEESTLESELASALADIKKQFHALADKALTEAPHSLDRQNLVMALQVFPFSFHDLTKLVDIMVYAYKVRGLCYQAHPHKPLHNADLILKRLEGLSRRSGDIASQWPEIMSVYDEQFLGVFFL